jgi:hypothetical protein
MTAQQKIEPPTLAKLREPFPAHQISKLPKPYKRDSAKGKCAECGGYHGLPAVHLDYVGHAALTDRLLDTDPEWTWEPAGFNPDGTPALDQRGGLWIKLTVLGVTRYGYGCADGKSGGDAIKEIIGDALRNAAMRFGAALDLWHKGDLHLEDDSATDGADQGHSEEGAVSPDGPNSTPAKRQKLDGPYTSKTALWTAFKALDRDLRGCGDSDEFECLLLTEDSKALIEQCERDAPQLVDGGPDMPAEFVPLNRLIEQRRYDFAQLATAEHMAGLART